MTYTFKMAGCLGDIIYALPTMRHLGGGTLSICPSIYTDNRLATGSADLTYTQVLCTMEQLACVLRVCAPYLQSVSVLEEEADAHYDLNTFRTRPGLEGPPTIPEMILDHFGRPTNEVNRAWLDQSKFRRLVSHPVVIQRTERYHNPLFPWRAVVERYGHDATFIGTPREHAQFCDLFGYVPYRAHADLLEVAIMVAQCQLFAGNQSVGYAMAEGFKHPRCLLELAQQNNNFGRAGVLHNPRPDQLPDL